MEYGSRPLTPWGLAAKKEMLSRGISSRALVGMIRAEGEPITVSQLSIILRGIGGQRKPRVVAIIDRILELPQNIAGRPA